jgi:hypothetical protein
MNHFFDLIVFNSFFFNPFSLGVVFTPLSSALISSIGFLPLVSLVAFLRLVSVVVLSARVVVPSFFALDFKPVPALFRAVFSFVSQVICLAFSIPYPKTHCFQDEIAQKNVLPLSSQAISIANCLSLASFNRSIPVLSLIARATLLASQLVVVQLASLFIASSHLFQTSHAHALNTLFNSFINWISHAISSNKDMYSSHICFLN